ncbi:MAG: DUF4493 domain-containing protein [Imperialibacter sp.]|uniref:DUF4493 domain-containing protein n=1 Tax=Imperialibacter sp. TaxID=2038411 RepID=UPI0032EFC219
MKALKALLLSFLFLTVACQQQSETPEPLDYGYLSLNLSLTITSEPANGRTLAVNTDDFRVTIFAADGTEVMVFDPFSSAPAEVSLPTGEYYVEAHSNNLVDAAFENPYYFGRSDNFTIDKEELKSIDIEAELANTKVAINYSANVVNTFHSYTGTVTVVSSGASLFYAQGETREGYFLTSPFDIEVNLSYTKLDGTTIDRTFTASIADPQPKTLYNINVDATLEDGKIVFNIIVDEGFDTVDIDLGDATGNPNANWAPGDEWIDERDGEAYGTVEIGSQVWMNENLRAVAYPDGEPIPEVQADAVWWPSLNTPAYSWLYNDKATYEKPYGAYYNYYVIEHKELCPAGWHMPTIQDWTDLESFVVNDGYPGSVGEALKTTSGWANNNNGTNAFGFSAVAAGYRGPTFGYVGEIAYWWIAPDAYYTGPYSSGITADFFPWGDYTYGVGLNVRCIKE